MDDCIDASAQTHPKKQRRDVQAKPECQTGIILVETVRIRSAHCKHRDQEYGNEQGIRCAKRLTERRLWLILTKNNHCELIDAVQNWQPNEKEF